MESDEVVIRPENPMAEINLNLNAPEREARKIASLRVKADVTIPGGMRTFKFRSLAEKDVTVKQGDVSLTLEDLEVDEQVWKVNVTLTYPDEGPAFESYRQGLFNNRLWLQRADGSRFEHNGGFSSTGSDGGKLGFEYIFVDAPESRPTTSLSTKRRARWSRFRSNSNSRTSCCRENASCVFRSTPRLAGSLGVPAVTRWKLDLDTAEARSRFCCADFILVWRGKNARRAGGGDPRNED